MNKEPLLSLNKDSILSIKSTNSRKSLKKILQEEYQIKKKEYIQKYGYVDKDPIEEGNCFSNFFLHWAYNILKLSNLVFIESSHLGKFNAEHSSATYFKEIINFWEKKNIKE